MARLSSSTRVNAPLDKSRGVDFRRLSLLVWMVVVRPRHGTGVSFSPNEKRIVVGFLFDDAVKI